MVPLAGDEFPVPAKELAHLQRKELQVRKKRARRHPKTFKKMAVERLKSCENIVELAAELGVHGRLLYKWCRCAILADGEHRHLVRLLS